jgi:signal transduction histidine kinase
MSADKRTNPLRRRLTAVLIALSLGSGVLFLCVAAAGYLWLERSMLDDVLNREMDRDIAGQSAPRTSVGQRFSFFRPAANGQSPPAALAGLASGSYLDYVLDDASYHIMVRDIAPGDRAWLLYNVEAFEARERKTALVLLLGIALTVLLSWALGGWAARFALRPLDSLVRRISTLKPDPHERLPETDDDGELSQIVVAINRLLGQITTLVDRERAFAGAAAHELRTPITSIGLAAELLSVRHGSGAALQRIERAVFSASQDLDALLALSSARQLPAAETLMLNQWLPSLIEPYEAALAEAGTAVSWRLDEVEATLSAAALKVIVVNLFRNAMRAARGGNITIELTRSFIAIIDDGCGIAPELLPTIFEPGSRGPNGGSGIGLYIANTLAGRCGWSLLIQSEPGQGTRAELRF